MGLMKISKSLCKTCKWHGNLGHVDYKGTDAMYCNYLCLNEHSRIFENGEKTVPDGYCDKYEKGKKCRQRKWTSDDMTIKKNKS